MTDDWGMFGYEPGYIFIYGRRYDGKRTLNDAMILHRMSITGIRITKDNKITIPIIPNYDFFPRYKFYTQEITEERTPDTFAYIDGLFQPYNSDDIRIPTIN